MYLELRYDKELAMILTLAHVYVSTNSALPLNELSRHLVVPVLRTGIKAMVLSYTREMHRNTVILITAHLHPFYFHPNFVRTLSFTLPIWSVFAYGISFITSFTLPIWSVFAYGISFITRKGSVEQWTHTLMVLG